MVKKCCVNACPSESYGGCKISFHSFPKDEEMRRKWLKSVHVTQKITKNSVVCSRHFIPTSFYTGNCRQLLKADAIPTINAVPKNAKIKVLSNILIDQSKSSTEILHAAICHETSVIPGTSSSNTEEQSPKKKRCLNLNEVGVQTEIIKGTSPAEDMLKRKVKVLSQRLNRRDNRLKNLQSILLLLKKKCKNFDEVERTMKNNFSNIHTLLNTDKSNKGVRYSDEVKKFALSLYFYSSKAYLFLRNHFSLPHPVTLRKMLATHNCDVGFIAEVFEFLKLSGVENYIQNVALIYDAMAIKSEEIYEKHRDKNGDT